MININSKIYFQLIIFTIIFLFSRIDNIVLFHETNIDLDTNYQNAIKENFLEYAYLQHVNMIGKILFDKIIFTISSFIGLNYYTIFYLFNILTSYFFFSVVILFINNLFQNNIFIKIGLFLFILVVSYFFDNYEIWKPNYHDHFIFTLITIFSLLILFGNYLENNIYIYLILFLLIASYTLGITFFIVFFFFIFARKYKNEKTFKKDLIIFFYF